MSHEPPDPFHDPVLDARIREGLDAAFDTATARALREVATIAQDPPPHPGTQAMVRCPVCRAYVPITLRDSADGRHALTVSLSADHTRADVYVRTCRA